MELWEQTEKRGRAADRPRLGVVAKNIEAYRKSFHARPSSEDKTKPNAACNNCHDVHSFNVPAKNTPEYTQWRLSIPNLCGTCHTDQLEAYQGSVHGQENAKNMLAQAAVCSDCHTAHAIGNTSGDPFKLTVTSNCGGCHDEAVQDLQGHLPRPHHHPGLRLHGQVLRLPRQPRDQAGRRPGVEGPSRTTGWRPARQCHNPKKGLADVLGRLRQLPAARQRARLRPLSADVGRLPDDDRAAGRHVRLLLAAHGPVVLPRIQGAQGSAAADTSTSGSTKYPPRPARASMSSASAAIWRIAHLIFAISLMVLTLTGMPLFYPDVAWAPAIMKLLGGPQSAGLIHRVAAVIFAGVFFWHLFYIADPHRPRHGRTSRSSARTRWFRTCRTART